MILTGKVIENSAAVLLARVTDVTGDPVTQADVARLTCKVFDADTETMTGNPTLDVADVVFNTLQKDARWTADKVGYNVAVPLSGDHWPTQGAYTVEVKVTPTAGDPFYLIWHLQAENVLSE